MPLGPWPRAGLQGGPGPGAAERLGPFGVPRVEEEGLRLVRCPWPSAWAVGPPEGGDGGLQGGCRARLLPRHSQGRPGVPSAATLGHQDPRLQEGPGGTGGDGTRAGPQLRGEVALGTCWKLSPRAAIPGSGPRSPRGGGHPAVKPVSGDPGEGRASLRSPCPPQRRWAGTG